ncbi:MAG: site-specific integrase [Lachnospiraceae bacterium]|nr:site-specific integrase [Lachnospiraceae bacterium]
MTGKRRDKKGRVLRNGECQRKDGLYQYDYVDLNGKAKCLYSWKLEPNDSLPQGKRKCKSLREKEREVQRNIDDGIVPYGGGLTVLALTKKYILQKKGVRESTRAGYKTVTNILEKEEFGAKKIDKVKLSDAKEWLIKLQDKDKRSYSSIHTIRGVLRPAFQMAVEDDLLRKNPFQFELVSVIVNDSVARDAITRDEKRKFLEFVKNDKHFYKYYEGIYILFYTGMRISEFVGLTIKDIDLEEKTIKIDHQLQRTSQMQYIIEQPKTEAGIRVIPMQEEVCECFKRIIQNRRKPKVEPMIDGKVGFLYLDKNEMPMVALHWEKYFQHIVEKYNKIYKVQMPKVTPHVCRHTYCSHCASSGMNPKHLQYLMGHSDISVTLNTYTHVDFDNVKKEVQSLEKAVL